MSVGQEGVIYPPSSLGGLLVGQTEKSTVERIFLSTIIIKVVQLFINYYNVYVHHFFKRGSVGWEMSCPPPCVRGGSSANYLSMA